MMRDKNANNSRKTGAANRRRAVQAGGTAEHRKTLSDGLRILARIIARAHLQRQQAIECGPIPEATDGERPPAKPHSPPPEPEGRG